MAVRCLYTLSVPAASTKRWTTRQLLGWMNEAFTKKGLDSPRLFAEMLLGHVIGCDRLRLYMEPERPASPLERDNLRGLVERALEHEPVQYLIGEAWFFGLPLHVDRRVLIPRPATETIAEHVLQHARTEPGFGHSVLIADVCTGSGALAVALAKHLNEARVVATDISPDALEVAKQNAERHGVTERVELLEGDLLTPLDDHPATMARGALHYLVCNPPYIPDDEWDAVAPNVKDHEPERALRGGADGLDFVRPVFEHGPELIAPNGLILVEIADSKGDEAVALASANDLLTDVELHDDHEGLPRVVSARRK